MMIKLRDTLGESGDLIIRTRHITHYIDDIIEEVKANIAAGFDHRVLAHANKDVELMNSMIRDAIYGQTETQFVAGESVIVHNGFYRGGGEHLYTSMELFVESIEGASDKDGIEANKISLTDEYGRVYTDLYAPINPQDYYTRKRLLRQRVAGISGKITRRANCDKPMFKAEMPQLMEERDEVKGEIRKLTSTFIRTVTIQAQLIHALNELLTIGNNGKGIAIQYEPRRTLVRELVIGV